MIGKIIIKGQIGSEQFPDGTTFKGVDLEDIVEQYEAQKAQALSFEVEIDSPGGYCDVGYSIYDFLKTIKHPVTTIAVNQCASIATVIFLAGERRVAKCPLMIHNPWVDARGDSDDLLKAAEELKAEEDKLINFYHKATGIEKVALDALMKIETYILPERAVKLGFATEANEVTEIVNLKAVAKFKTDYMSKEIKTLGQRFDALAEKLDKVLGLKKDKAKALSIQDESGKTLEITNADGTDLTGNPAAGNIVMVEGAPAPAGDYTLPSVNMKITVDAGGIITAVSDMSQEMTLEQAIEKLTSANKEKEALEQELKETKEGVVALEAKFAGLEKTLSAISGKEQEFEAKNQFREGNQKTAADYKAEAKEREKLYKTK